MIGNGYVGPMGAYLSVSFDETDWHIMIRRTCSQRCNSFCNYHGRTVAPGDVEQFLPNWDLLEWQPTRKGVGPSKEITADDGEFRVALITMEGCTLAEGQIIKEFRQFMAESAGDDADRRPPN
jgi:hypothetical protein